MWGQFCSYALFLYIYMNLKIRTIPNGQNNLLCQKLVSADISEVGQGRGPVSGSRILFASKFGTGFLQNDKKPFHKAAKMVFYKQQNLPKFKGALEEEKQAVS